MIKSIFIQNFKIFEAFSLELNDDLNLIVGDNESGKSTILEAINLALTKRVNGKLLEYELSPYLFNTKCTAQYLADLKDGKNPRLPEILIELYLDDDGTDLQNLRGNNNSKKTDCPGIKLEIVFDEDYKEEYAKLLADETEKKLIPAEYYRVHWYSFANNAITARSLPIGVSYIDATTIRLQSGTDYYIQNIISEGLEPKEKVALAVAYRKLKEQFSSEESIKSINQNLRKGAITTKNLSIAIDISQKANWENNLTPHLDELPFQLAGKGEQSFLKIMLALERKAKDSHIILIEEPENHLSFSSMSLLIDKVKDRCNGKQIVVATHSAYVLNKLGLDKVIMLNGNELAKLNKLPADTYDYFKKLSGYDTLRLILAKKSILVEGPSDELIVQRAYRIKNSKLPIDDGIDVINIRGLSFKRFLDIAKELKKQVVVITDNDGDYNKNITEKYADYSEINTIKICADNDNSAQTLEPQFVNCNDLSVLNKVFGKSWKNKQEAIDFMVNNKTEWSLTVFETSETIVIPSYIQDAIQ
jgi:predicted ATP-dependent endonuclease of OLD family